jgi:uncharacterized spore protein YtfJ
VENRELKTTHMENLNDVLGKVTEFLKSEAKTETIIGEPFKLGDFTCVPVMSLGIGFGGGSGDSKGNEKGSPERSGIGVGGAAGMGMGPVGFLVSNKDQIQFISTKSSQGLSAAIDKLPGLIEKFITRKKEAAKA